MVRQSLTIWEKSEERSIAKKYLSGNFESGHRTPNEHYLGRAGLRGRKRWLCLTLFVLVYIFALAHLMLTCVILGVLRFDFQGSLYLDFQGDNSLTWPQGASLTQIRLSTPSSIEAYTNHSLNISGNTVTFQSHTGRLSLSSSSVNLFESSLQVYSGRAESTTRRLQLSVSNSAVEMQDLLRANNLTTTRLTTHTVRNTRELRANGFLRLRGAVGVNVQGGQVDLGASGNIHFTSQGAIAVDAKQVVLSNLPRSGTASQYHLCSCENGRLFLAPAGPSHPERCAINDTSTISSICT